jgi:hypothetical protein
LAMHIEPGPGVNRKPFELQVRDGGRIIARAEVERLQYLDIPISWESDQTRVLSLHVEGGDLPIESDPRRLNFRLFWCGWSGAPSVPPALPQSQPLPDIPQEDGLALGAGWQPVIGEANEDACFVAADCGEILVRSVEAEPQVLRLELAPGGAGPFRLEVRDISARVVATGSLHGRQICYLTLPVVPGPTQLFTLGLVQAPLRENIPARFDRYRRGYYGLCIWTQDPGRLVATHLDRRRDLPYHSARSRVGDHCTRGSATIPWQLHTPQEFPLTATARSQGSSNWLAK